MEGERGLGDPQGVRQVAGADGPIRRVGQVAQQAHPRRVGERLEDVRKHSRIIAVKERLTVIRTAVCGLFARLLGGHHAPMVSHIDISRYVRFASRIDELQYMEVVMSGQPSVLFVCVKNGGKSQIAAALMRKLGGVSVSSAGTKPGSALNEEAAMAVAERGASMAGEMPRLINAEEVAGVDRVVVLGAEAVVEPVAGMRGRIETWITDEPSQRGIEGMERMRLVVADIAARVETLHDELLGPATPQIRVFEPALCCNTGVCGTDVDEALVTFTADLDYLKAQGVDIARHNLANDPTAFAENPVASDFLRVAGSAGLPLVLVDQVTVATGRYPDRDELRRLAGLADDLGLAADNSCCEGTEAAGCCPEPVAPQQTARCTPTSAATGCC